MQTERSTTITDGATRVTVASDGPVAEDLAVALAPAGIVF
jgi:hypothetical protein